MAGYEVFDRRGPYAPNCGYCLDSGCTFCEGTIAQRLKARLGEEEYARLEAEADAFVVKHLGIGEDRNRVEIRIPGSRDEWLAFVIEAFKYGEQRAKCLEPIEWVPVGNRFDLIEL